MASLPVNSSHITSPVVGHILIKLIETFCGSVSFESSTKHMNGGGVYRSSSSTELRSSTYLARQLAISTRRPGEITNVAAVNNFVSCRSKGPDLLSPIFFRAAVSI